MMQDPFIDKQLADYRLTQKLGRGGFANVYLGQHVTNFTPVAIKIYNEKMDLGSEEMENFLKMVAFLQTLRHPNIVQVLGFGRQGDIPFLILQYAPNGSLQALKGQLLPPRQVATYVKQVASALQYLHGHKKTHCDIKPSNMLVGSKYEILLSDFDIVTNSRTSQVSALKDTVGTLAYMAPEHIQGLPQRASDQYSLALVAYEWLSGSLPFSGPPELLYQQKLQPLPALHLERNDGVRLSPQVARVLERALHKDPAARYPQIQDFAQDLENALLSTNGLPTAPTRWESGVAQQPLRPTRELSVDALLTRQDAPGFILSSPSYAGHANELTERETPHTPIPAMPANALHFEQPLLRQQALIVQQFQYVLDTYAYQIREEQQRLALLQKSAQDIYKQKRQEIEAIRVSTLQLADGVEQNIRQKGWETHPLMSTGKGLYRLLVTTNPARRIPQTTAQALDYKQAMNAYRKQLHQTCTNVGMVSSFFQRPNNLFWTALGIALLFALLISFKAGFIAALVWFCMLLLLFLGPILSFWYHSYILLQKMVKQVNERFTEQNTFLEKEYQVNEEQLRNVQQQRLLQLEQDVHVQLQAPMQELTTWQQNLSYIGLDWNDSTWQQWQAPQQVNAPVTRIGSLNFASKYIPRLPLLVPCPLGCTIIFKINDSAEAQKALYQTLQALVLRILATQPTEGVRFSILDDEHLGESVKPFLGYSSHIPNLFTICSTDAEIEEHLNGTKTRVARMLQGVEQPELAQVLITTNIDALKPDSLKTLQTIASYGQQYQVSNVFVVDTLRSTAQYDGPFQALTQNAYILTWNGRGFSWENPDFPQAQIQLDSLPLTERSAAETLFTTVMQQVVHTIQTSHALERSHQIVHSNGTPTLVPAISLGRSSIGREAALVTFKPQSASNLLVVGNKSDVARHMLTATMLLLAMRKSPQQVQFYVVNAMPDSGAVENDFNPFTLLQQQLTPYFRTGKTVREIVGLRTLQNDLPRLLQALRDTQDDREEGAAIDQEIYFFIHGLHLAEKVLLASASPQNATMLKARENLDYLLRKGASMHIHALAWCDSVNTLRRILGDEARTHFDYRVALRASKMDLLYLLERAETDIPNVQQASFFDRDEDAHELFSPFTVSKETLERITTDIQAKWSDQF